MRRKNTGQVPVDADAEEDRRDVALLKRLGKAKGGKFWTADDVRAEIQRLERLAARSA